MGVINFNQVFCKIEEIKDPKSKDRVKEFIILIEGHKKSF